MTEFNNLQPGDETECIELWTSVFGASRGYFERYLWSDKNWKPIYTRLCKVDGKIVSAVQIVRRTIRVRGQKVSIAGIANVATHPQHRGQGYSTRLMEEAQSVIDEEDFVFGLLFTGIHDFYRRLGWHAMPDGEWIAGTAPGDLSGWSFRESEEADLQLVMRWYEEFNTHHSGSVVRDEDYWHGWRRWNDPGWRSGTYIVERDGQPSGYVWIAQHNQRDDSGQVAGVKSVEAREMGCALSDKETLCATLRFTADTAYRLNAGHVEISLPERGYRQILKEILPDAAYHTGGGAMVRVGNRNRLIDAFRLIHPEIQQEQVPEHPETALRLLLGNYEELPEGVDPEIGSYFPPSPVIYWEGDGF